MNFIFLTAALVTGIFIGNKADVILTAIFLVVFIVICIIKYIKNKTLNGNIALGVILVCVGILNYNQAVNTYSLDSYEQHYCDITGVISSVPYMSYDNYKYEVEIKKIALADEETEIDETIILTTPLRYEFGDVVTARGILERIDGAMNDAGFDAKMYYKSKNITYKLYSEEIYYNDNKIDIKNIPWLCKSIKANISELIDKYFEGDNAAIINAVITGNKTWISDELNNSLYKSGAGRFLYSAYFYILLIMGIEFFDKKISKRKRTIIMVILLLGLAVFNSDKPVFLKASIYTALVLFIKYKKGYIYKTDVLMTVAVAILLSNPLLIYNGGFVISIVASLYIILFGNIIKQKIKFTHSPIIKTIISSGLICTIALLPVTSIYFECLTIYALFEIFIFFPVNILIWFSVFPSIILYELFGIAPVFSQILSIALGAYKYLPNIITKLPLSYIYLARPNTIVIICSILITYLAYIKFRNRKSIYVTVLTAVVTCFIIITQLLRIFNVEFTFVNVGQGDGAVISIPYRGSIVIDGGGGDGFSEYNPGESIFVPYLIKHGKHNIDAAFITHFHSDHTDGVIEAVKELNVKALFIPDTMSDCEIRLEAEKAAYEAGTKVYYISQDTRVVFDNGLIAEIFVPDERTMMSDDENDTSLVINVMYGDVNCLFTGDMTMLGETSMLIKDKVPEAEILKVAHHGSATSTSREWVEEVNPEFCVISLAKDNMYGFPKDSVLENLYDRKIYRTDENGDITVIADKKEIKTIKTYK